jgi:peroxiredoxin
MVCCTLLLVAAASGVGAQPIASGRRAPEIDLPTLNGGRFELSKLRGHPVILSFWGTWCPPCRDEFPELVRVQATHADAGLYVVGVNGRDQEESTKDVQRFVDAYAVSFTIALDKRGSARRSYRIEGQPTTVFIDASGIVRKLHTGLISREKLDEGIALIFGRGEKSAKSDALQ